MIRNRLRIAGVSALTGVIALLLEAPFVMGQGATEATASLTVKEGFHVEHLYKVPKEKQGSWVSVCVDDQGDLIASDQYGSLYRVDIPAPGENSTVKVSPIDLDIGHAQGLLYAFDSLYVVVNSDAHQGRGLYRVRDTNGDNEFDQVKLLKKFPEQGGEHGPHAVVLGPNERSLYVVVGDQTPLPDYHLSRVPEAWGEDLLLPRIYGRGFMKGVKAPRGWIAKTDPRGEHWEMVATGFRNEYDAAFNRDGELFTFDADMEWDMNTPWYRPTRLCHVVSGAEFGWRNGSGKWPSYFPDNLPPVVNIGPGSPTGVTFAYGTEFPKKYRNALFICDWSYGKLYAVHLQPKGSTYSGTFEEVVSGAPLPLTDIVPHPGHGALYFTVGGRRTQSALYRLSHKGDTSSMPSTARGNSHHGQAEARAMRHKLEEFHGHEDPNAVEIAWPYLGKEDRFLRWAARTAIEHQDPKLWQARALKERDPQASLEALLALARVGNDSVKPRLLKALGRLNWSELDESQKLALLRVYSVTFVRMGEPDQSTRKGLIARFDPKYPASSKDLNAELCTLLVYLQAPSTAEKTMALLRQAPTQEEQIEYAKSLRLLERGWTLELRKEYFSWFLKAANYEGGASFNKFVADIKNDAVAHLSETEKRKLKPILEKEPEQKSPMEVMAQTFSDREFVKQWSVDELANAAKNDLDNRDFERGRKLFGAAACFACHRFGNEGGAIGPDLTTVGNRFSTRDLLESIIHPSKAVSDQYNQVVITLKDGSTVTGRIMNLAGDNLSVNTNMFAPGNAKSINRNKVKSIEPSGVSPMPSGLLNMLTKEEILDLLAYLLSGGDRSSPMFEAE